MDSFTSIKEHFFTENSCFYFRLYRASAEMSPTSFVYRSETIGSSNSSLFCPDYPGKSIGSADHRIISVTEHECQLSSADIIFQR